MSRFLNGHVRKGFHLSPTRTTISSPSISPCSRCSRARAARIAGMNDFGGYTADRIMAIIARFAISNRTVQRPFVNNKSMTEETSSLPSSRT